MCGSRAAYAAGFGGSVSPPSVRFAFLCRRTTRCVGVERGFVLQQSRQPHLDRLGIIQGPQDIRVRVALGANASDSDGAVAAVGRACLVRTIYYLTLRMDAGRPRRLGPDREPDLPAEDRHGHSDRGEGQDERKVATHRRIPTPTCSNERRHRTNG